MNLLREHLPERAEIALKPTIGVALDHQLAKWHTEYPNLSSDQVAAATTRLTNEAHDRMANIASAVLIPYEETLEKMTDDLSTIRKLEAGHDDVDPWDLAVVSLGLMHEELVKLSPQTRQMFVTSLDKQEIKWHETTPAPTPARLVTAEECAATFVERQLEAAENSLKRTRLTTTVLLVAVVGYSVGITTWMNYNVLQPRAAADIATARAVDFVKQGGAALSDQIVEQLPVAMANLPDMVLDQLPHYRMQLEDQFEHSLADYSKELETDVEGFLAQFLNENHDHVQAILGAANDPKLTKHFGDQLEQELLSYLKTPNNKGESAMDMLDQGRGTLEDVETRLHRLAHANDLTPEELKLRRIIAATLKASDANL